MRGAGRPTSSWDYIDFELEIREGSHLKYPVCVRSPGGEAEEQMHFPFDNWELKDKLQALEIALLRSGRRRRIRSQEEQAVQDFGQALFEALLVGKIRTRYEVSMREARRQNKGLRLKLRIEPPELANLPWEFLYDSDRNAYLCLSYRTPLVRYVDLPEGIERLSVTPPLKILGMVASPRDLDPLDAEHEKRLVEEAIKDLQADGLVELTWLVGQTRRDLQRAMWGGPWHVFHFIGHGGYDPNRDEGLIALSDASGHARFLPAEDLAQLFKDHYDLRLVLLNSCEGAKGSERDAFSSTAVTLVRPGIPAVVAMQYEITDEAAIEFSRTFYEAVAHGLPLDAAVAGARTSLKTEIGSTLEWGTPVLYMRSPDGRIFDISTAGPSPEPIEQTRDREEEKRQRRLDELYAMARRSHQDQEWQAVVGTFDEILTLDSEHPDPEGLLASAREELAALEQTQRVAAVYDQGLRHMEAEEWEQALECFEEVQLLKPGHQETEKLLSRVRDELAKPPTVEVPDLTGQSGSEARSTLAAVGLELGDQDEAPSETIPEGEVIEQAPVAGTKVERGSSARVTVSSGPEEKATIPDVSGRSVEEAGRALEGAGLVLAGSRKEKKSRKPSGTVISTDPSAGSKVASGSSVTPTVSSGPRRMFPWITAAALTLMAALVGLIVWSTRDDTLPVPNLVGQTENAAGQSAGDDFVVEVSSKEAGDEPKGTIISQDPGPGERAQRGSPIFLAVSTGQPEKAADTKSEKAEAKSITRSADSPIVAIRNTSGERIEVKVEIADEDAEQLYAFDGRTTLAEDAGIFYNYHWEQPLSQWAKDVPIPLSVAYIDAKGRIVDIQDMQPFDATPHPSAVPAQYALEVNQGFFRERGVEVGNTVDLPSDVR